MPERDPGLVGGTPIQNVGAYGQEVTDTITRVRVFDRAAGSFVEMDRRACGFGYRASVFKRSERWIVTSVRFEFALGSDAAPPGYAELSRALSAGGKPARVSLETLRETVLALRRAKGMVVDPDDPDSVSAGSFFVNPVVGAAALADVEARAGERPPFFEAGAGRFKLAAAWLVERAGFPRGWGRGRVGVSRKHALALVNRGGATAHELLAAARSIRDGVRARFGVELDPEPVLVGCSWQEKTLCRTRSAAATTIAGARARAARSVRTRATRKVTKVAIPPAYATVQARQKNPACTLQTTLAGSCCGSEDDLERAHDRVRRDGHDEPPRDRHRPRSRLAPRLVPHGAQARR